TKRKQSPASSRRKPRPDVEESEEFVADGRCVVCASPPMTCVVGFVRRAPNDHLRCISDEGAPDGLRAPRMGLRGCDDDPPSTDALKLLRHHSFLFLRVARGLGENA